MPAQLIHSRELVVEADVRVHSRGSVGAADGSGDGESRFQRFSHQEFFIF